MKIESIRESQVVRVTGVSASNLREFRDKLLAAGLDWHHKNGAVWYTPAGLEKIAAEMKRGGRAVSFEVAEGPEPVPEKKGGTGAAGAEERGSEGEGRAEPESIKVFVRHSSLNHKEFLGVKMDAQGRRTDEKIRVLSAKEYRGNPNGFVLADCVQAPDGRWWHRQVPQAAMGAAKP